MPSTDQSQKLVDMLDFASQLVRQGGEIIGGDFRSMTKDVKTKNDHSYVTATDQKVERVYREAIKQKYPDHAIVGEELGGILDPNTYTWILDPLDGTTNFISGIPIFCSMISVYYQGKTILATVYDPNRDKLYVAAQGQGATSNGLPFPPQSNQNALKKVTLMVDCGRGEGTQDKMYRFLVEHGSKFRSLRKFGCVMSGLALAENSMLEVSLLFDVDIYDLNSTSLILGEAGYTVMVMENTNRVQTTQRDMIICTQKLEQQVVALFDKTKLKYQ